MQASKPIWRLSCTAAGYEAGDIEDEFCMEAMSSETEEVTVDGIYRLTFLLSEQPHAERLDRFDANFSLSLLPDQDWMAVVARGETQVEQFMIVPFTAGQTSGTAIQVDGTYAFGDGHHATTRSCIEAMAALRESGFSPRKVADIGCGTGILALAAQKLWPTASVSASDLDGQSVSATAKAAQLNGLDIRTFQAEGFSGHSFWLDLIVMNLLSGIIINLAEDAATRLNDGGRIIVSGCLEEQAAEVIASYSGHGLYETQRITQDGWVTMIFGKANHAH